MPISMQAWMLLAVTVSDDLRLLYQPPKKLIVFIVFFRLHWCAVGVYRRAAADSSRLSAAYDMLWGAHSRGWFRVIGCPLTAV